MSRNRINTVKIGNTSSGRFQMTPIGIKEAEEKKLNRISKVHYKMRRQASKESAEKALDWLLQVQTEQKNLCAI